MAAVMKASGQFLQLMTQRIVTLLGQTARLVSSTVRFARGTDVQQRRKEPVVSWYSCKHCSVSRCFIWTRRHGHLLRCQFGQVQPRVLADSGDTLNVSGQCDVFAHSSCFCFDNMLFYRRCIHSFKNFTSRNSLTPKPKTKKSSSGLVCSFCMPVCSENDFLHAE